MSQSLFGERSKHTHALNNIDSDQALALQRQSTATARIIAGRNFTRKRIKSKNKKEKKNRVTTARCQISKAQTVISISGRRSSFRIISIKHMHTQHTTISYQRHSNDQFTFSTAARFSVFLHSFLLLLLLLFCFIHTQPRYWLQVRAHGGYHDRAARRHNP